MTEKIYLLYFENDVWGNKKEGYEVNNTILTNVCFELNEDFSNEDLGRAMKKAGILKQYSKFKFLDVQGDDLSYLSGVEYRGYPFGAVMKIKPGEMITITNCHREFNPENFQLY